MFQGGKVFIADGVGGSATSFTIIYSDSKSNSTCGSAIIEAVSCTESGIQCTHSFDTSSSLCPSSTSINVTVYATNLIGDGPHSEPVIHSEKKCYYSDTYLLMYHNDIGGINNFIDVNFDHAERTITCTFHNQPSGVKQCTASIHYGDDCNFFLDVYMGSSTSNFVITAPLAIIKNITEYCYNVTATIQGLSIVTVVEGKFNLLKFNGDIISDSMHANHNNIIIHVQILQTRIFPLPII